MAAQSSRVSQASAADSASSSTSGGAARGLLQRLTATTADVGPLVARVALGVAIFPHGAQKALGWFGGYGLTGTMGFFTGQLHIPAVFAALVIAAEFLGAIGLIVGFVQFFAPKFQRFPTRPRFYGDIDVPSLPAVTAADFMAAKGGRV